MSESSESTIFVSRAGADRSIAIEIAAIIRSLGYKTILQDENFGHTSFMAMMHDTLASGARVAALLSQDYLRSDNCAAEWQAALTGDPQNKRQRLIVLRVSDREPTGLLKPIPYIDLSPILANSEILRERVTGAFPRRVGVAQVNKFEGPLIDSEVNWEVSSFTGREVALSDLEAALFKESGIAAVTQSTAVHGMGGVGKSALAREYARRNRTRYSILWWLNAEKEEGIIEGLIRLGGHLLPALIEEADRPKAAKRVLSEAFSFQDRPALLVFDNLEDRALLSKWRPQSNCHILATTRLHGWGGNIKPIELSKWSPSDACNYLLGESGRTDFAPDKVANLARELTICH